MNHFLSKFFMPFSFGKKNQYLPAPEDSWQAKPEPFLSRRGEVVYSAKPYKTLATFELEVEPARYEGEVPEAKIKFYSLDAKG